MAELLNLLTERERVRFIFSPQVLKHFFNSIGNTEFGREFPEPVNGDYAQTDATQRILDAINGTVQSLKLNIEVREI